MIKIAIFSHDAGSSQILLSLVEKNIRNANFQIFCLKNSPCYLIAQEKHLQKNICTITEEQIEHQLNLFVPNLICYGTGWINHLDWKFLEYGQKNNLKTIAFLDHYINYKERFQNRFPDFIATHDAESYKLALSLKLPNLVKIKNYSNAVMLEQFNSEIKDIKIDYNILYLSEPTAKVANSIYADKYYWGFTEMESFTKILQKFSNHKILIRLHPSDDKDTYQKIDSDVEFSTSSLLEDINRAKIIIGIDTIALRIAYLLGKKVLSYIPSNKRDFSIPLPKNNQVRDLTNFDMDCIEINKSPIESFGIDFALFIKKELG